MLLTKRFLQKYADEKIAVWAITTTNEPLNGIIPLVKFNSLGWLPDAMVITFKIYRYYIKLISIYNV